MDRSDELFLQAKNLIPGGVHSPVRSFGGLPLTPRFIESARGAFLFDVDGRDYIDFCMGFGPLVLGHSHPKVYQALKTALENGTCYGACEPYSLRLVESMVEKIPFVEQVRLVNSGTEAVMTALRLARAISGKNKIMKFEGHYHGHGDAMLIKAGSGLAGEICASSSGIPNGVVKDTVLCSCSLSDVKSCLIQGHDIAAVIVEPLAANNGLSPADVEFLKGLREITRNEGILLVFDEVISGFRTGLSGMAGELHMIPDLLVYGKIIGGGLPVGAVAGSASLLERLAPVGDVYQAGTLSGNPLAAMAGLATLKELTPSSYTMLDDNTKAVVSIFNEWFARYNKGEFADYEMISSYSLIWPKSKKGDEGFGKLFKNLLDKGIYLSPHPREVGFISTVHDGRLCEELKKRLWSE